MRRKLKAIPATAGMTTRNENAFDSPGHAYDACGVHLGQISMKKGVINVHIFRKLLSDGPSMILKGVR